LATVTGGPNLVRNFSDLASEAKVIMVSDLKPENLAKVQTRYPTITVTTRYQDLLVATNIDAVAIATPVSTHFQLAQAALRAGKHVLVEKPLTATAEQAAELIEEANRRGLILMVDHTFVYTAAVRKIRELIDQKELGEIYYYDSVRINLGLFQHDVNVLWDLAVHDLSIMDYVLSTPPVAVSATGMSHLAGRPENIAYLTLFFDTSLIAHFHLNWLAPVKLRRTLIGGAQKMVLYDDIESDEKVKVYDKGITLTDTPENIYSLKVGYRTGDVWIPQLEKTEALKTEVLHFVQCINTQQRPLTDGEVGLRIVRILEAATESMKGHGKLVRV
jgi:predicted dehydrogenase